MQHSNTAGCILLKFYIKPQPSFSGSCLALCCILSKFHIKPQPTATMSSHRFVVSYRNSTSNHNNISCRLFQIPVVSYRNSTSNHNCWSCTLAMPLLYLIEIPHQTTTQRNIQRRSKRCILSKFHIKPQLLHEVEPWRPSCILSKFHIKPQLRCIQRTGTHGCILSKFHIKPQRRASY